MDRWQRGLADLQVIGRYLARRDVSAIDPAVPGRPYDVLVLCGSGVLATAEVAARAFHHGVARRILVTGGIGHSTPYLADAVAANPTYADVETAGRSEAAVIAEILRRHLDVPAGSITTEEEAANCGQNAELSLRMLATMPMVSSLLLVQDPSMQRRTHASFDHHQRLQGTRFDVVSHAPFLPLVRRDGVYDGDGALAWPFARFASLAVGEVRRLYDDEDGYGPRGAGFIDHVEVPDEVLTAARRLRATTWAQNGR